MRSAQIIKRTESTIFYKDGEIVKYNNKDEEFHHIMLGHFGHDNFTHKLMVEEEVIGHLQFKTQKELNELFWNYIENNKLDSRNYYLVY